MLYRPAEADDIPAIARIRALEWGTPGDWELRVAAYLSGLSHPRYARAPRASFVAVVNDNVVGFAAGHLTTRYDCNGELQWINVTPKSRRSGAGSELLRLMAGWFIAQDARRICVDVDPANATARAFYTRHGATELNPHWLVWRDVSTLLTPQE